jgi:UDP-glucose 4-epimerase
MVRHNVHRFIFSSSAAIYGEVATSPITEDFATTPINPYGWSKLMVEKILADYSHAYGIQFGILRYFNAAGASPDASIGEDHDPETHLIPLVLECAFGKREYITIFGDNYDTPDGTCVRDYIHVCDLAEAHLLVLERLKIGNCIYNLGNGEGYSVREVIECARKITGKAIPEKTALKRQGDPTVLVASSKKIQDECGWQPKFASLSDIIENAWNWHRNHPGGFGTRK